VAVTDLTLAEESIDRGLLVVPFGLPLKTRGVYSLCLQPSAASHPACAQVMQWFCAQAQ
jgi:LysR family glycine cleavage system transcriptional activator